MRVTFRANLPGRFCVHCRMHTLERYDAGTLRHLAKPGGLLLKLDQAELAKNPTSRATESSRRNLMAVLHTVRQVYGSAVAIDVADLVQLTAPAIDLAPENWTA
jgi:hypothetical protein